ncbi:MAG: zf-HC2 domain-containing protein [Deltaproteobacteria bacterium]|nr:zf-HC2 domain-containing protein [Deltaproteobacteria bacterium]
MDCVAFEIAVEQRRHGALGPEETRALEAHLAGCERCRAYAGEAARADAALAASAEAAVGGADWARLEASVRRQVRSGARRVVFDLATVAVAVPPAVLGLAPEGRRAGALGAALLACAAAALVRGGYHGFLARRARGLAGQELLAFHRAALRADLRRALAGRWLALAGALGFAAWAMAPGVAPLGRVALAEASLLVAGTWIYVLAVRVPRLRRQLASLGEERG